VDAGLAGGVGAVEGAAAVEAGAEFAAGADESALAERVDKDIIAAAPSARAEIRGTL